MDEEENKFYLSNALKETIREKVDTGKNQSIFVGIVDENDTDSITMEKRQKMDCPLMRTRYLRLAR